MEKYINSVEVNYFHLIDLPIRFYVQLFLPNNTAVPFHATISKYFKNSASCLNSSCSSTAKCIRTSKTLASPREKFGKTATQAPTIDECIRNAMGNKSVPISYFSALPEYQVFMNISISVKSAWGASVSDGERDAMREVMWLIVDRLTKLID